MSDNDQAEADLRDDAMGDDLATQGASHDPEQNGATDPVKAYEAKVAELLARGDEPEDEDGDLDDSEANDGNGEEDESEAEPDGEESPEGEDEEESAEEEEAPSDEEEEGKPQARFRIRAADEVEAEALALRKRHPDWSLKDCIAKAEQVLGVSKTGETDGDSEDTTPARTSEIVAQEIEALLDAKEEALKAMEFDQVAILDRKFRALTKEESTLLASEAKAAETRQDSEAARFDSEWDQSEARAVAHYPDCTDKDSALTKRMGEIDARMKRLNDPLFDSPNKPFLLAKQAAKELGIPMIDPAAARKPAAKKAVSTSRRLVTPASGNARTTEPAATATKLEKQIGSVKSLDDYESLVNSVTR